MRCIGAKPASEAAAAADAGGADEVAAGRVGLDHCYVVDGAVCDDETASSRYDYDPLEQRRGMQQAVKAGAVADWIDDSIRTRRFLRHVAALTDELTGRRMVS